MRAWDTYDAYLFDIDGTLLNCTDAVHYFGFCEVLSGVAGRPLNLDGVVAHGNVDVGILRDALALAGVEDTEWRPRIAEMRESLSSFVEARSGELCVDVLPGVREVLEHLRGRGAKLGVATGNLERIGWAKLDRCGLRTWFDFGGFSDAYEYRGAMIAGALSKARVSAGESAAVCVVGDTPSDIRAARENGLDVIAVATGIFSREALGESMPDLLVGSMKELLGISVGRDGVEQTTAKAKADSLREGQPEKAAPEG